MERQLKEAEVHGLRWVSVGAQGGREGVAGLAGRRAQAATRPRLLQWRRAASQRCHKVDV